MKPNMNSRGFTLIEVMATLALLSISMVILIKSQTQSIGNVLEVQYYERAVFITENQLHWTFLELNEAESWEDLAELSGEDGDYNWRVTIELADTESEFDTQATLLHVVASTIWPAGNRERELLLETFYLWGESR